MNQSLRTPIHNIRCRYGAWWLGHNYEAITWFGTIWFNCTKTELQKKLNNPDFARTERHEYIHLLQAKSFKTKYLGFYLYYIAYWLRNLIKFRNTYSAYLNIPFEKEAYANENDNSYQQSRWRNYR